MIDLSSNINFIKPEVNLHLEDLNLSIYPNEEQTYINLASSYGVSTEELELFSGESSAIYALFKHLDLKDCTLYSPIDLDYKKACVNFAYELRTINRFENINLPVKSASLVVFTNPSSIEGTLYELDKLFECWIEQSCTILIDESFLEFTEGSSAVKYLKEYDKLYIIKSISSFYGCAGLRISAIISNKDNINTINRFEAKHKLSTFDMYYLEQILKDKNFKSISRAVNVKSRIELEKILQDSNLVENIYQSSANFVLIKLKEMQSWTFQKLLEAYNIKIKECESYDFLDSSYIRINLCSKSHMEILKEALSSVNRQ
jgi:threonine-phosphate decarboxylase